MPPPRSRLEWMRERKTDLTGPLKFVPSPEKVTLMTGCPDAGWMEARLTIGTDIFPIVFSDVYPSFADFVVWLEKLILEEPADAVWADDEDQDHFFHAVATDDPAELVFEYVRGHHAGDGVYRRACVTKDQLILEFYSVLSSLMRIPYDNALDENDEYKNFSSDLPLFVSFNYDRHSDDIVQFDLSKIEAYLTGRGLLSQGKGA